MQNELIPKQELPDRPQEGVRTTSEGNSRIGEFVGFSGADTYYFDGELDVVQFAAEPALRTTINGTEVYLGGDVDVQTLTVGSLIDDADGDDRGYDYDEFINYELEVQQDLSRSSALVTKTFGDTVDGNVARGHADNLDTERPRKRHSYTYRGDLIRFTATGDAGIYLNGRQVPAGEIVQRHTLTIDGTDDNTTGATTYEFEVESDLQKSAPFGSGINAGDTVDGTEADGVVTDGRDSYEYVGDLLRFKSFGGAEILLDGRAVDLSPSQLTITGTGDPTEYDFEVRNEVPGVASSIAPGLRKVGPGSDLEPADTVDGTEASGLVTAGSDAYRFTGDLRRFTADGEVDVELDGETIRPRDVVEEHTVTYAEASTGADFSEKKYKLAIDPDGTLRRDDAISKITARESRDLLAEEVGAIRENFVRGAVPGNRDTYVFTGEVTWSVAGDAVDIILDGEPVTADELGKL